MHSALLCRMCFCHWFLQREGYGWHGRCGCGDSPQERNIPKHLPYGLSILGCVNQAYQHFMGHEISQAAVLAALPMPFTALWCLADRLLVH